MPGNTLDDTAKKINCLRTCKKCGVDISDLHFNAKYCKKCTTDVHATFDEKAKLDPNFLNDKIEGVDYVTCVICGYRSGSLQAHLRYKHNLTPREYRKQYNAEPFSEKHLEEKREQWSGEKNPGFNHGGKLSPWSYKNPSKSKEEIDSCKAKTIEAILKSENLNTRIEYWLKVTNGDKELAQELLSKRQRTFLKRLEKDRRAISASERQLFSELIKYFPGLKQQIEVSASKRKYYFFDMGLGNKLIEYNGDYWHANPIKYKENDILQYPGGKKAAKDVWKINECKINCAQNQGYDVLVIWETDFIKNKSTVIEKCRSFLSEATI